jgi:hypothetical protein
MPKVSSDTATDTFDAFTPPTPGLELFLHNLSTYGNIRGNSDGRLTVFRNDPESVEIVLGRRLLDRVNDDQNTADGEPLEPVEWAPINCSVAAMGEGLIALAEAKAGERARVRDMLAQITKANQAQRKQRRV